MYAQKYDSCSCLQDFSTAGIRTSNDLKVTGEVGGVFEAFSCMVNLSTGVLNIHETKMLLLVEDPLPLSVYIGRY